MILAIDPGVTTGFATIHKAYQVKFDSHRALYMHLNDVAPTLIIYEPFHWRQGQTNAVFTGVEYIGVIKLWAQTKLVETVTINPSDGKGFWKNDKIKALEMWIPGLSHGMDATRLLLTYKMKIDKDWFKEVLGRL